jgi:hypothetical protein
MKSLFELSYHCLSNKDKNNLFCYAEHIPALWQLYKEESDERNALLFDILHQGYVMNHFSQNYDDMMKDAGVSHTPNIDPSFISKRTAHKITIMDAHSDREDKHMIILLEHKE